MQRIIVMRHEAERATIAAAILTRLPQWFGRPESTARYVADAGSLPMLTASVSGAIVGFVSLRDHTAASTEIVVMGVDPGHQRGGIGAALIAAAEDHAGARGATVLFVRTLGTAHPDPYYAATRAFYIRVGFLPVEELPDLWGPGTPSLLLVKPVAPPRRAAEA